MNIDASVEKICLDKTNRKDSELIFLRLNFSDGKRAVFYNFSFDRFGQTFTFHLFTLVLP